MVSDKITDGTRIGQLFSSEIHGHERSTLGRLAVVDADEDATPSDSGTFGFAIAFGDEDNSESGAKRGDRLAEVYLHPERIRVDFLVSPEQAVAATDGEITLQEESPDPPRSSLLVESGAEVKAALRVVERIAEQVLDDGR